MHTGWPRAGRQARAEHWASALSILREHTSFEARLDQVLARISALTGRPDTYLYLPDEGARHLHLERTRARPAEDQTRATPAPIAHQQEGGAEWSAPNPRLELTLTEEDYADRVVATPVGTLYAIAMRREDESLAAVVQAGPLGRSRLPRRRVRELDAIRRPLAFVLDQARETEALRRRLADMSARVEASHRLAGSALDIDRFTALLLDLAVTSTGSDAGFVAIPASGLDGDERTNRQAHALVVRAHNGMPADFERVLDLSPEHGLFDWSLADDGGALMVRDPEATARLGIRSLLAVPLIEAGVPLGIFALVNFGEAGTFDATNLELCDAFAEQIRLMLDNGRTFRDFTERYLETVSGLAQSLDARSRWTSGHHRRVAAIAVALADALGLDAQTTRAIHSAALIHDVGLAGSSELEGGGDLDVEHPAVGASLVEHLPLHPELTGAVATHHEWYDGWGFPSGLRGDQIPLGGRVLGIAEFIVELGSPHPLREPWSATRLSSEIERRSGTQFDPAVASAAIELLHAGRLQLGADPAD